MAADLRILDSRGREIRTLSVWRPCLAIHPGQSRAAVSTRSQGVQLSPATSNSPAAMLPVPAGLGSSLRRRQQPGAAAATKRRTANTVEAGLRGQFHSPATNSRRGARCVPLVTGTDEPVLATARADHNSQAHRMTC
jgi:hypothetical protein